MMEPTWPRVRCRRCGTEAHWRNMVLKQDADDKWVKWHLCPRCEALETGQTEAEVMEATFKKPMEHKTIRVQRYKEVLKKKSQEWEALTSRGEKKEFLRVQLEEMLQPLMQYIQLKREALALVAKDVEAHNALVQKLKESSSLQEDAEIYKAMTMLEVGHGLVSAKLVSANVVSANLVSFILSTDRGLSTNRCCVLKSVEEH